MNRALPGRAFFAAAYILLAVIFTTIHFTRVENFSSIVDTMVLKGRSSVGTALSPSQIRRLKIGVNGMELRFRKSSKAVLVTDDGIRHPLDIIEWSSTEDSITVYMDNGAGFILFSDPHGTGITLTPVIPDTEPPVRSLELPFNGVGGTVITVPEDRPGALSVASDDQEYVVDLPSDSTWEAGKGRLNLVVLNKANPVLAISDDERAGGLGAAEWYELETAPSENTYVQAVDTWMKNTRSGWSKRLDPGTGLWLDETGTPGWNDRLASALLADSVTEGELTSVLQSVLSVAGNAPREPGWRPSPYLGDIVNLTRLRANELQRDSDALVQANAAGRPDFGMDAALTVLVDTGRAGDAVSLLNSLRQAPPPETPNTEILDRIRLLQEARDLSIDERTVDAEVRRGYFDGYIISRIFMVEDHLWLVEEDGSIRPELSVLAGRLLMKESRWNNDAFYQALGRQLVISVLAYSDENGMIPERILFEGSGDVVTEGRLAPEAVFRTIVDAPAYPRHVSLAREMGSGSWVLTGAERFTLRGTPRETTVTMDYPAGSIHHLAIRGVKPFNVLFMNGIRWNGDPNFQRYYAGWFYDEVSQTLFIKIRHRTKTESIRILYYDPDAPAAPAEPEGATEEAAEAAG